MLFGASRSSRDRSDFELSCFYRWARDSSLSRSLPNARFPSRDSLAGIATFCWTLCLELGDGVCNGTLVARERFASYL